MHRVYLDPPEEVSCWGGEYDVYHCLYLFWSFRGESNFNTVSLCRSCF